jgi:hypothetical protein
MRRVPPCAHRRFAGAAVLGYFIGTFPTADLVADAGLGRRRRSARLRHGQPGWRQRAEGAGQAKAGRDGDGRRCRQGRAGQWRGRTRRRAGRRTPRRHGLGGRPLLPRVDRLPRRQGRCRQRRPVPGHLPRLLPDRHRRGRRHGRRTRAGSSGRSPPRWPPAPRGCWAGSCGGASGWRNLWGPRPSLGLPLAAAVSSAVIAYKFSAERGRRWSPRLREVAA